MALRVFLHLYSSYANVLLKKNVLLKYIKQLCCLIFLKKRIFEDYIMKWFQRSKFICHGIFNDHRESGRRFNVSSERQCFLTVVSPSQYWGVRRTHTDHRVSTPCWPHQHLFQQQPSFYQRSPIQVLIRLNPAWPVLGCRVIWLWRQFWSIELMQIKVFIYFKKVLLMQTVYNLILSVK